LLDLGETIAVHSEGRWHLRSAPSLIVACAEWGWSLTLGAWTCGPRHVDNLQDNLVAVTGNVVDLSRLVSRESHLHRPSPHGWGPDHVSLTLSQDLKAFGYREDRHDERLDWGGACREEEQVHQGANDLYPEASRAGYACI